MYVPLRTHGHHSLLCGVDRPAALLERARELGLPALALADVNSLAGLVEFLQAAGDGGPRPIVAAELSEVNGAPGRLIALVESETGYRNLCRLLSARHLGGDPGSHGNTLPALEDFDLARQAARYQEGLIFLADHPRLLIELHERVPARNVLAAISPASLAKDTGQRRGTGTTRNAHLDPIERDPRAPLGADEGSGTTASEPERVGPGQAVAAHVMLEAARATGVATVAVPDVYHARAEDHAQHRLRVAIGARSLLEQVPAKWLAQAPAHLLSAAEMVALYAELEEIAGPWSHTSDASPQERQLPGALARTLAVARRCRYTPPLGGVHFPQVALAAGESAYSRLSALAFAGASKRYRPLRPEVLRRLAQELSTINDLGFAPYFLLVKDIADFARGRGIPCVGRGSAADSLVAHCLYLTDADPLRYRLPFERFLNPERRDRPDIDLDFCWRRREEVLEHVYELFGAERTAMICTLNRFGLRSAFREAALALGQPPALVNRWAKRLPHYHHESSPGLAVPAPGLANNPVAGALASAPEARAFPFEDKRWRKVLVAAAGLLDAPRHFGLHPGGVVVSPGPITDFSPCQRAAAGMVVTQFDKDPVEAVGLVKMDLLGNRALTVLADSLATLAEQECQLELETIPENDPATARLLATGSTIGCFQIESPGMRGLLQQSGAQTMDDVIQAIALIRPGPAGAGMKDAYVRRFRGLEPATPPHPRLTELLWDTHGIMLYQEDVLQAVSLLTGMDLGQADLLRRALQNRRGRDTGDLRAQFQRGCTEEGLPWSEVRGTWELIANFAAFAFCKAHAVTYGRIAYRTAWLKAHYPAVFMTAFLASETGYYPRRVYVEEARRLGVPILGPSVNRSARSFAVEWNTAKAGQQSNEDDPQPTLRTGLSQVKGLSQQTLERILTSRAAGGAFTSLPDLMERSGAHGDEAENLIQCGALDDFDRTRPELLWRLHLLRTPRQRLPQGAAVHEAGPLDMGVLDSCNATPKSRRTEKVEAARSGAWGQAGLGFGDTPPSRHGTRSLFPAPPLSAVVLPGLPDTDRQTRGQLEFELLGFTLTDHPLRIFPCPADERAAASGRRPPRPTPCARLAKFRGGRITLRGWPAATRRLQTEQGDWMRFVTLEDESGVAEAVLFPDVYRRDGQRLAERGALCITGVVDEHLGAHTLRAERIW